MRAVANTLMCMAACAVALAGFLSLSAAAGDNPAHALADKFARAAEEQEKAEKEANKAAAEAKRKEAEQARAAAAEAARREAEKQRADYEADMLRRAATEAEERRAAEQRAFEEQERREAEQQKARLAAEEDKRKAAEQERARIEAEREKARLAAEQERARAEAARLAQEAEERRKANERHAEEARKAEAARLAREVEEKRRADELAAAEAARRAEAARLAREAEEKRLAEERRQADQARAKLEEMRMEEARRIAEKFRLAREARERARGDTRNSLGGPLPPEDPSEPAPWSIETGTARSEPVVTRVTVLLLMEPRRIGFGRARTANPVLCLGRDCYISAGSDYAADRLLRWQALGPGNSIGRRAGPCRNHLGCVFRNVELPGGSGAMQPVDMGLLRHDRREIKTVRADRTCDVVARRLYCGSPVVGRGYRAWIVPEAVAVAAGPYALEAALGEGLPAARSAEREDWLTNVHALPAR